MDSRFIGRNRMIRRVFAVVAIAALTPACDTRVNGLVGVSPPATSIGFQTQPSSAQAGAVISPTVQVAVLSGSGQPVTTSTASIFVTIVPGTGTAGAVLTGGGAQTALNGVVNFNNLRIDLAGTGYQLQASAAGFTSVTSTAFNITP
jgi:hypothetical protein